MQPESSPTVRVSFLDGEAAIRDLRRLAQSLLARRREAASVILFGSLARGNYAPGSDADLLIVLEQDERRLIDRIPDFLGEFLDAPVPVDVFPYTKDEIERMQDAGNRFIERALGEGVRLAERVSA